MVFAAVCAVVLRRGLRGLNSLCLALSPVALIWAGLYSFSKRFTWMCHVLLGSVLGLAPVAGWLAFDPAFSVRAVLSAWGWTFWTAGFDILYACQDVEFDRDHGPAFHPRPVFGIGPALAFSALAHVDAVIFFAMGGWAAGLSWIYFAFFAVGGGASFGGDLILSEKRPFPGQRSFFTINGVVAAGAGLGVILDVLAGDRPRVDTVRPATYRKGGVTAPGCRFRVKGGFMTTANAPDARCPVTWPAAVVLTLLYLVFMLITGVMVRWWVMLPLGFAAFLSFSGYNAARSRVSREGLRLGILRHHAGLLLRRRLPVLPPGRHHRRGVRDGCGRGGQASFNLL